MGMSSLDVLSMAAVIAAYWHCSHSMESGVYVTVRCLSVCLFQHEPTAANLLYAAAGLLLWAWREGDIGRLLHSQRSAAAVGECGQCHVVSVCRKLNTDLYVLLELVRNYYWILDLELLLLLLFLMAIFASEHGSDGISQFLLLHLFQKGTSENLCNGVFDAPCVLSSSQPSVCKP